MTGLGLFILFLALGFAASPWWFVGDAILLAWWFVDDYFERRKNAKTYRRYP